MGTEFNIYDNGKNPKKTKDINVMREHLGVVLYVRIFFNFVLRTC